MNLETHKKVEEEHRGIQDAIDAYLREEIKAPAVKKKSAHFGIYEQNDGKFMCRIRLTGGEISTEKFLAIGEIVEKYDIDYIHISTRANIQLHGVPATKVYDVIRECTEKGLPFRGGGGNTFRSVLTSIDSGLSKDTVFDVLPHARKLNEVIYFYDKAFYLGRKFKVSFSSSPRDGGRAKLQDLGFVATKKDGKRGFEVYAAGGMGRGSATSIKLMDFLPEDEYIRATKAMIDFFDTHGNRTNRSKARLRFLLQELGKYDFISTFNRYFEKTPKEDGRTTKVYYGRYINRLKVVNTEKLDGYDKFFNYSTHPTRFGKNIKSVEVQVNHGKMKAKEIKDLATTLIDLNIPFIRVNIDQNIYLPFIHQDSISYLYKNLLEIPSVKKEFKLEKDMVSCIGAQVCKMGVIKSPVVASATGEVLDDLSDKYNLDPKIYWELVQGIKFSGCPSSCSGNAIASIGFHGMKQKVGEEYVEGGNLYLGGLSGAAKNDLAILTNIFIPTTHIPQVVGGIVEEYINNKEKSDTFMTYVHRNRDRLLEEHKEKFA